MKIKMDKYFTEKYMEERTKNDMKEFKQMFTDGDLLNMFRHVLSDPDELPCNPEIVRCDVSAFPGGTMETDETHYAVDMLLEGFDEFQKVHFYMTHSGTINLETWDTIDHKYVKLWEIKHYKAS